MARVSFEEIQKIEELKRKEWHKQQLKNNREKAIRIIKTELPKGVKLKEYLDILDAEIQKENQLEKNLQ